MTPSVNYYHVTSQEDCFPSESFSVQFIKFLSTMVSPKF